MLKLNLLNRFWVFVILNFWGFVKSQNQLAAAKTNIRVIYERKIVEEIEFNKYQDRKESLDISNKKITSFLLRTGEKLPKFNCSWNEVEVLENWKFYGTKNLLLIDISHNKITKIESQSFEGLSVLQALFLDFNSIVQLDLGIFDSLVNLTFLGLSYNQLEVLENEIFRSNRKLEFLHLQNNKVFAISSEVFYGFTEFKNLNLEGNICLSGNFNNTNVIELLSHCFQNYQNYSFAVDSIISGHRANFMDTSRDVFKNGPWIILMIIYVPMMFFSIVLCIYGKIKANSEERMNLKKIENLKAQKISADE